MSRDRRRRGWKRRRSHSPRQPHRHRWGPGRSLISRSRSSSSSNSSSSSRSRSRDRDRIRDRSHSRGRDRSRSRSRTRSRSRGYGRSRSRDRHQLSYRQRSFGGRSTRFGLQGRYQRFRRSRSHSRHRSRSNSRHRSSSRPRRWRGWRRSPSIEIFAICSDTDSSTTCDDVNPTGVEQAVNSGNQASNVSEQTNKTWEDCGVDPRLKSKSRISCILKGGHPSDFQARLLAQINTGCDVIVLAENVTTKDDSFAFGLPIYKLIMDQFGRRELPLESPIALVLAPTPRRAREIASHVQPLTDNLRRDQVCLVGENNVSEERRDLKLGCDFVISTPGRLVEIMDIMKNDPQFTLKNVKYVVLADTDISCQTGLGQQISIILGKVHSEKQVVLISSNFSKSVSELADELLTNPVRVPGGYPALAKLSHQVTVLKEEDRFSSRLNALLKFFKGSQSNAQEDKYLILVNNDNSAQTLAADLAENSLSCCLLQNKDAHKILDIVMTFKSGSCQIMVMSRTVSSTDLDITQFSKVVNYDCPHDFESYVNSCRLVTTKEGQGIVHTFITKEQGHLSGFLISALSCSMCPSPFELKELYDTYKTNLR